MKSECQEVHSVELKLLSRPRYMCREWNLRKLRSLRALSVPNFKLLPSTRPLFDCQRCHFSNDRYHICLFCGWTSEEAEKEFHCNIQHRTLSSPYRLELFSLHRLAQSPSPRTSQVALSCAEVSPRPYVRRCVPVSGTASDTPTFSHNDGISTAVPPVLSIIGTPGQLDSPSVTVADDTHVVTATLPLPPSGASSSPLQSVCVCDDHDAYHQSLSRSGGIADSSRALLPEEQASRFTNDGVDRSSTSNNMNFTTKLPIAMSSSQTVPFCVLADVNSCPESQCVPVSKHDSKILPSLSMTSPTQRTLRHKKRHSILHFSAPASYVGNESSSVNTARPQSQPTSNSTHVQPTTPISAPSTSTRPSQSAPCVPTHNRSQSQPNVHLGHRDRPYYSAIRKDMSMSSRANFSTSTSANPFTALSANTSRSAFSPTSSRSPSPVFSQHGAGISLFSSSPISWSSLPIESERASWLFVSCPEDDAELPTPTFSPPSHSPLYTPSTSSTPSKSLFHIPFRRSIDTCNGSIAEERRNTAPTLSKKEETELRMALAREVGHMVVEPDEGYVYREKRKMSIGGGEVVKARVKKLTHGIKTFVKRNFS